MRSEAEREILQAARSIKNKPKAKMEFSKRLAQVITGLFILTWIVAWLTWIFKGELPSEMLDFITVPFSVVITGYFAKSGFENTSKIKNTYNEYGE